MNMTIKIRWKYNITKLLIKESNIEIHLVVSKYHIYIKLSDFIAF